MTLLQRLNTLVTIFTAAASVAAVSLPDPSKVCNVKPLGHGRDDTSQVGFLPFSTAKGLESEGLVSSSIGASRYR
jgi:hypothetical protein